MAAAIGRRHVVANATFPHLGGVRGAMRGERGWRGRTGEGTSGKTPSDSPESTQCAEDWGLVSTRLDTALNGRQSGAAATRHSIIGCLPRNPIRGWPMRPSAAAHAGILSVPLSTKAPQAPHGTPEPPRECVLVPRCGSCPPECIAVAGDCQGGPPKRGKQCGRSAVWGPSSHSLAGAREKETAVEWPKKTSQSKPYLGSGGTGPHMARFACIPSRRGCKAVSAGRKRGASRPARRSPCSEGPATALCRLEASRCDSHRAPSECEGAG